jgi:hypothetical protein
MGHGISARIRVKKRIHKTGDGKAICGEPHPYKENPRNWDLIPEYRCKKCLAKLEAEGGKG